MTQADRQSMLQPLSDDLPSDVRAITENLRTLFASLGVSVRRYSARRSRDPGSVSRFPNGSRTPPWEFVLDLARDVASHRGQVLQPEALELPRRQHRQALSARSSPAGLTHVLQDQLASADEQARHAAIQIQALTEMLQDRQRLLLDLELQLRRLEGRTAIQRIADESSTAALRVEREAFQDECERLRQEVAALREELSRAKQRAVELEDRCDRLEGEMVAVERSRQAAPSDDVESGTRAVCVAEVQEFTRLMRRMELADAAEFVATIKSICGSVAAELGGALIRAGRGQILIASDSATGAADIALRLVDALEIDGEPIRVQIGLAIGEVVGRQGDLIGLTTEVAASLADIAPKGVVLVDGEFATSLEQAEGGEPLPAGPEVHRDGPFPTSARFVLQPMWRRPVRGLGLVEPWRLTRLAAHS
ncbi:hypothetical protein ACFRMQ_32205 [Kitasatospora sp. NPDC056783]|uniref:hypothetical protein n=1 Tax=Kitasatospora sp. NPDC056783 TaxID=3345943 RepID=UPI0036A893F7